MVFIDLPTSERLCLKEENDEASLGPSALEQQGPYAGAEETHSFEEKAEHGLSGGILPIAPYSAKSWVH